MIDLASIITIIIAIVIIYLLIRFIVSPILKIILAIIAFLILIYILQKYFGFDVSNILAPFGISFDFNEFASSFNWLLTPLNNVIDQIKNFLNSILGNLPKK